MNPLTNERLDKKIVSFFKKLGYDTSWDFSKRTGEYWYEFYKGDILVAQIDMGIPLEAIIEDLKCDYKGKPGTSNTPDYKICGSGKLFDEFEKRVYEYKGK